MQLVHLSSNRLPTNGETDKHFVTFGYMICRALVQTFTIHNSVTPSSSRWASIPFRPLKYALALNRTNVISFLLPPLRLHRTSTRYTCYRAEMVSTPLYSRRRNPCPGPKLTHDVSCFQKFHRPQPRFMFAYNKHVAYTF